MGETPERPERRRRLRLVPRYRDQGYDAESVDKRRRWVEEITGARLDGVGGAVAPTEELRGNVENPIGTVQTPLGVAGPLWVRGEHLDDEVYVPLATTEGALVRSYERGMAAITRAGGAQTRVWGDRNRIAPIFELDDVAQARSFAAEVEAHGEQIRAVADGTTRFGRLETVHAVPVGRRVILELGFFTGDAHGMNMLSRAAGAVCAWLSDHLAPDSSKHLVLSGFSAEKRPAGSLLRGGKGKKVTAGCRLPPSVVRSILRTSPEEIVALWRSTVLAHLATGAYGYNGHAANGLTALMIATGQDVANIANAAVCITSFEMRGEDLEASVTLPSLTLATVGGGTGLGTSAECLEMLGCRGSGRARRLAEIAAATVLAGELSMGAALASGEFVAAHEAYGRNRPGGGAGDPESGA